METILNNRLIISAVLALGIVLFLLVLYFIFNNLKNRTNRSLVKKNKLVENIDEESFNEKFDETLDEDIMNKLNEYTEITDENIRKLVIPQSVTEPSYVADQFGNLKNLDELKKEEMKKLIEDKLKMDELKEQLKNTTYNKK